jgi:uncharacterized membrane protein
MKYTWIGLVALGLGALVGCSSQSPAGGPGAKKGPDGVQVTQSDNTFKISVPNTETDIKQGQAQTVRIGINRGKSFDQDVKLEFKGAPKGVTVTSATSVAKPDMKEVAVKVEAAPDAPLGEFKVTVAATPAREGEATSTDFKVEVKKP